VKKDMHALANRGMTTKAMAYFRDPAVSLWRKLAGFGALIYVVSPIDAVPDVIPVFGWLDDIGVLGIAAMWMMREIKKHSDRQANLPTPE
jgi:uncharacterized membrane protein YkvA (DUF1232 family)